MRGRVLTVASCDGLPYSRLVRLDCRGRPARPLASSPHEDMGIVRSGRRKRAGRDRWQTRAGQRTRAGRDEQRTRTGRDKQRRRVPDAVYVSARHSITRGIYRIHTRTRRQRMQNVRAEGDGVARWRYVSLDAVAGGGNERAGIGGRHEPDSGREPARMDSGGEPARMDSGGEPARMDSGREPAGRNSRGDPARMRRPSELQVHAFVCSHSEFYANTSSKQQLPYLCCV